MEIQQEHNKPYVHLDEDNCVLTIKGASYPEHAGQFYNPILKHIESCLPKMKQNKVTVNLAMLLMNSVTEKSIYKILTILNENADLHINWYYEIDDEDMRDEANMWKSALKTEKFNIYSVKDINKM